MYHGRIRKKSPKKTNPSIMLKQGEQQQKRLAAYCRAGNLRNHQKDNFRKFRDANCKCVVSGAVTPQNSSINSFKKKNAASKTARYNQLL